MMKISWVDKISSEEVLAQLHEMRTARFYMCQETSLNRTYFVAWLIILQPYRRKSGW